MKILQDKPLINEPDPDRIPEELKEESRWCVWRLERRDETSTKVPYTPSGTKASSTTSSTWSSFQEAIDGHESGEYDGVGFFLGDGYVGIDLDDCREPETGTIEPWAQEIMARLPDYYWEVSPSGSGLHGIGRGGEWLSGVRGRRRGRIEIYSESRYFTVTGHALSDVDTIGNCDEALRRIHEQHVAPADNSGGAVTWSTEQITERRRQFTDEMIFEELARDGAAFSNLWDGKWQGDYPSQSEADLALCSKIAFYVGADPERIERLFSGSKLAARSKWNDRPEYRQCTIEKAITGATRGKGTTKSLPARFAPKPINLDEARRVAENVIEKSRQDPGAPFEDIALRALHVLKSEAPAEFERIRAELKGSSVGVSRLDDAIRGRTACEDHAASDAPGLDELLAGAELFHTPDGTGYITVDVDGHRETWPVLSRQFKRYLIRTMYLQTKMPPNEQTLKETLSLIEARAQFDGKERDVFVRVAEFEMTTYIDLCNSDWQIVEVSHLQHRVVDDAPVGFRRSRGMLDLPLPSGGGSIDALRRFLNIANNRSWVLIIVWVLMALRPRGPYPVLGLHGEQGSAKSTTARVLRSLIDPSTAPLRSAPREGRDLMISAKNSWLQCFDNLSRIPPWLSDAICRLATGGGLATRQLYTDDDETLFDAQRPILLNGIEELAERGDLVERSIIIELPSIPEEEREAEASFWADFHTARPKIFGALLTALSGAMKELPHVEVERSPRMADFSRFGVAVERALGWPEGCFLEAYRENIAGATQTALEASNLAPIVIAFVAQNPDWVGTATELRKILSSMLDESVLHEKWWPKQPNSLAGALRRLAPSLRKTGVHVDFERRGRKKIRQIRLKQGERSSPPSPSSHPPTSAAGSGGYSDGPRSAGDDGWDDLSSASEGSSHPPSSGDAVNPKVTTTSTTGDDGDDGDDLLQTSEPEADEDTREVTI